jgi:hypothetical protein
MIKLDKTKDRLNEDLSARMLADELYTTEREIRLNKSYLVRTRLLDTYLVREINGEITIIQLN